MGLKRAKLKVLFQDSKASVIPQCLGQGWLANLVPIRCVSAPFFPQLLHL